MAGIGEDSPSVWMHFDTETRDEAWMATCCYLTIKSFEQESRT